MMCSYLDEFSNIYHFCSQARQLFHFIRSVIQWIVIRLYQFRIVSLFIIFSQNLPNKYMSESQLKWGWGLELRKEFLSPPVKLFTDRSKSVLFLWPIHVFLFVMSVILLIISNLMYVSENFSYLCSSESPPVWERAADSDIYCL